MTYRGNLVEKVAPYVYQHNFSPMTEETKPVTPAAVPATPATPVAPVAPVAPATAEVKPTV